MGRHHRHSSRSRSRDRHSRRRHDSPRSRSKEHSRYQKEKHSHSRQNQKDKKFMFDSPPKEGAPIQIPVDVSQPIQPNLAAFQSAQQVQQSELMLRVQALMASGGMDPNSIKDPKADKKLYVGNLPANITPQMLCDAINLALIKMNINQSPPGNSALSAWISTDGHYAFVEFRTAQEATNAFTLNNVAIFGQPLKVGRPKQYSGSQLPPPTMPNINISMNDNPATSGGDYPQVERIHPPSRILVLKNMVQQHELEIDEEYNEIKEDVKDECNKYGEVKSLKIPRPGPTGTYTYGVGKIFVEFDSIDSAKVARKNLVGRTFSNKTVECSYHSEAKYAQNDFSDY